VVLPDSGFPVITERGLTMPLSVSRARACFELVEVGEIATAALCFACGEP
jgi:hypothetical protein